MRSQLVIRKRMEEAPVRLPHKMQRMVQEGGATDGATLPRRRGRKLYSTTMEAIVLFSHGSVLCGAEQNVLDIARSMEARGDAHVVRAGFLNYSTPTFEEAIEECVSLGATEIRIAPYFLVEGKFVVEDLPGRIEHVRKLHPSVNIAAGRAIVDHELLVDALLEVAKESHETTHWRLQAQQAERFCRDAPRCPLYATPRCPANRRRIEQIA
jgi:sirohydrochlorin ferrochelatase